MTAAATNTILFVDDEKRLWTQYRDYFSARGFTIKLAGDGCEAVRVVREEGADLVVMDLHMPHVDGELSLEVLREIAPKLPVIVLSGFVTPDQVEEGIPGAQRVLLKPVSLRDLEAVVREVLEVKP